MATSKRTTVPTIDKPTTGTHTAVDVLEESPTTRIHDLLLAALSSHPHNPRKDLGDVSDLAESLNGVGLLQPITVVPNPDEDPDAAPTYLVLEGHRRVAAAALAGWQGIPAIIRRGLSLDQQISAMLTENLRRADLTVVEEGDAYAELLDLGLKRTEIEKRTGTPVATVTQRVKIASLPALMRDAVISHTVTLAEAVEFSDLSHVDEEAYAEALVNLTPTNADANLRGALHASTQRRRWTEAVKEWSGKGHVLVSVRPADPALSVRYTLKSTPTDHANCPGAVLYLGSATWIENAEAWGEFYCVKPELHKKELAAIAKANKAGIESPQQREPTAEEKAHTKFNEELAAASEQRTEWLSQAFAGTTTEATVVRVALAAFAFNLLKSDEAWLFEAWSDNNNEPIDSADPVIALAGTIAVYGLNYIVPQQRFDWPNSAVSYATIHAFLTLLSVQGYELSDIEKTILAATQETIVDDGDAPTVEEPALDEAE